VRAMASSEYSSTDVLLREFTHRVKNEFASAIQVVSFAAEKSHDRNVKAALEGVMEKLHDYADVHSALQMPSGNDCIDASAYLRDLCGSISRSKLANRNIELVLVDRPFRMSSERCWLLGMIVAELITNAARHAFDQNGGTVRVECRPSGELVECRVSDNGSASTPDVRPGSGLRIIHALAQKLDAEFQFNLGEAGSQAVIIVPIEHDVCLKPASLRRTQPHPAHAA
jgi:two-component sensor histidine kinase